MGPNLDPLIQNLFQMLHWEQAMPRWLVEQHSLSTMVLAWAALTEDDSVA